MLKPLPLPALGESDGEEEKARDESDVDEAGDVIDEDEDREQQSRVKKHGARISKIKSYALYRRPEAGVRTIGREKMADSVSATELTSRSLSRQSGCSSAQLLFSRSTRRRWPLGWNLFWTRPPTRARRSSPTGRPILRSSLPRGSIYDFFIASFIFYNQDDVIMNNIPNNMY